MTPREALHAQHYPSSTYSSQQKSGYAEKGVLNTRLI